MSIRARIAPAIVTAFVLGIVAASLPAVAAAGSCSNEEIRAEQGSQWLPDCRAFELVTPEVKGDISLALAAGDPYGFPDGEHVSYVSTIPIPGAGNGGPVNNLSKRTASGWENATLSPPTGEGEAVTVFSEVLGAFNVLAFTAFTGDFSAGFVDTPFDADIEDQDRSIDAYRVSTATGASTLASRPDTGPMTEGMERSMPELSGAFIAGVSQDGSHVLFDTLSQLPVAPGTPAESHSGNMLYDRTAGHTYAVGVLPDGTIPPSCSVELGNGTPNNLAEIALSSGAISPDGSNVIFTTKSSFLGACAAPGVYLRRNNATTVQLSGGTYLGRSADGSRVFTANGSTSKPASGIHVYDVPTGQETTINSEGWLVAMSSDGSLVYYLIGAGPNAGLYLWNNGSTTLIPGAGSGFGDGVVTVGEQPLSPDWAVATPDGSKLLFLDRANLTNRDVTSAPCVSHNENYGLSGNTSGFPENCPEAYVYDANTEAITCVSCNPSETPPLGITHLMGLEQKNAALPPYSPGEISADGSRVFFETEDALVPQDTNGRPDVYEWESGRVQLISSGQGIFGSSFSGASADGHDVFITTIDHLAPQDIENSTQIYDARIGGGFQYRPFIPGCDSGQCQGPQTPAPAFEAPASATFVGLGNPVQAVAPSVKAKPKAKPKKRHKGKSIKRRRAKLGRSAHRTNRAGTANGKGRK
jgi:choice-of-anchor A domain-containing protein